jgi:hypothetical protein
MSRIVMRRVTRFGHNGGPSGKSILGKSRVPIAFVAGNRLQAGGGEELKSNILHL